MTTQMTAQQRRDHNNGETFRVSALAFALLLIFGVSRIVLTAIMGVGVSASALVGIIATVALLPVLVIAARNGLPRWFNPVAGILLVAAVGSHLPWIFAALVTHTII